MEKVESCLERCLEVIKIDSLRDLSIDAAYDSNMRVKDSQRLMKQHE
jgi:hypothetical protein